MGLDGDDSNNDEDRHLLLRSPYRQDGHSAPFWLKPVVLASVCCFGALWLRREQVADSSRQHACDPEARSRRHGLPHFRLGQNGMLLTSLAWAAGQRMSERK